MRRKVCVQQVLRILRILREAIASGRFSEFCGFCVKNSYFA